jgi:glucokinase
MRDEEQAGGLHAALARMVWSAAPSVRLHFHRDDDTLVAELVQADVADEVRVLDHLLVEFDGTDDDGLPTAVYLTGVQAAPASPAAEVAADLLGPEVWATATALVAGGTEAADVELTAEEAAARRACWRGLAARLREQDRTESRLIGVEFVPGRVHAVLTNGEAEVLDEAVVALDSNDPAAVVEAIAQAAEELAWRHAGTGAEGCPIGVQLGGPVHTPTGTVEYYDKPLHDGDESWKGIPLGALIYRRTGRQAVVFNDAAALAEYEIRFGLGRRVTKFAVMVVRGGVGAKLVRYGRVEDDFPLEIGVFVPAPEAGLGATPERQACSIEASSGVDGIIAAVNDAIGTEFRQVEQAAAAAEKDQKVVDVFSAAGRGLARGVAAIQAVVDPEEWVVHAPHVLTDESGAAGWAFMGGLRKAAEHLHYAGFWPTVFTTRAADGRLGGQAAASAASYRSGR